MSTQCDTGTLVMAVVVIFKPPLMAAGNFNTKVDSSHLKTCVVTNGLFKNQTHVSLNEIKPKYHVILYLTGVSVFTF